MVVLLCSNLSPATGSIFEVGAGWHARTRLQANPGVQWRSYNRFDAETVSGALSLLTNFEASSVTYPGEQSLTSLNDQAYRKGALARIETAKTARGQGSHFAYTGRDVILYSRFALPETFT
jgi:hypothetical protein